MLFKNCYCFIALCLQIINGSYIFTFRIADVLCNVKKCVIENEHNYGRKECGKTKQGVKGIKLINCKC